MADKHFIFTMTTGRSGTAYLAEFLGANLPDVEFHHEFRGWDDFGLNAPDVSHMTLFNSQGNIEKVREFWRHKLARIVVKPNRFYVETAHTLMKAGLIENLATLTKAGRVHLIDLQRDPVETIKSFRARFDFLNKGNLWLWYLDPDYPRNLSNSKELSKFGYNGLCLWYITEIRLRAAYYEKLLAGNPNVQVLHITMEELTRPAGASRLLGALGVTKRPGELITPQAQNVGPKTGDWTQGEEESLRTLVAAARCDASALAEMAIKQGLGFEPALPGTALPGSTQRRA
jgi:hypothetical protein